MDATKSLDIQHQVRENTEELQDYLRDLINWENEIKKKDEELSKKRERDELVLPPIRNLKPKTKKKKKVKNKKNEKDKDYFSEKANEETTAKKSRRVRGTDYKAWDQFNVDEALKDLERTSDKSNTDEEESDSEDEQLEIERQKQLAIVEKDKGNQYFKKGEYDMAISCYTCGMQNDPNNALLPANRAMALLKKGQLAAAEQDCDLSISLDPTYVKAYHRRGTARAGLKKFQEAKSDFLKVLKLDKDNKQAKLELEKLEKELAFMDQSKVEQKSEQQKQTKEVVIPMMQELKENEISLENELTVTKQAAVFLSKEASASKIIVPTNGKTSNGTETSDMLQKALSSKDSTKSCVIKPIHKLPHLRSKKPLKTVKIKDVSSFSDDSSESGNEHELSVKANFLGSSKTEEAVDQNDNQTSESEESKLSPAVKENSKYSSAKNISVVPTAIAHLRPPLPAQPQTSYQFLADWKKLKLWPDLQYQYVMQLSPEKIPEIFKQSIDTDLFSDILKILSTAFLENQNDIFMYLKCLSQVGRFHTLIMFLADDDIHALNRLLDSVKASRKYSNEEVQEISKKYGLLKTIL